MRGPKIGGRSLWLAGELDIDFDNITSMGKARIPAVLRDIKATLACLETNDPAVISFHEIANISTGILDGRMLKILNAAPARALSDDMLDGVRLVINGVEATAIAGRPCDTVEQAAQIATRLRAIITLGEHGAVGPHVFAVPFDVRAVDTTGAGDAFCAALAVRLAEGADLPDAMRFANAAGALACTKHGAYPSMPHRADVEALLREQGSGP